MRQARSGCPTTIAHWIAERHGLGDASATRSRRLPPAWRRLSPPLLEWITMRLARSEDLAAIVALTQTPTPPTQPTRRAADPGYRGLCAAHRARRSLAAGDGPNLPGLIILERHEDHAMIFSVAVSPAFQGKNLGIGCSTSRTSRRACGACRRYGSTPMRKWNGTSRSISLTAIAKRVAGPIHTGQDGCWSTYGRSRVDMKRPTLNLKRTGEDNEPNGSRSARAWAAGPSSRGAASSIPTSCRKAEASCNYASRAADRASRSTAPTIPASRSRQLRQMGATRRRTASSSR